MIALISFIGLWLLDSSKLSGGDGSTQYAESVPTLRAGRIRVAARASRTTLERPGGRGAHPWCAAAGEPGLRVGGASHRKDSHDEARPHHVTDPDAAAAVVDGIPRRGRRMHDSVSGRDARRPPRMLPRRPRAVYKASDMTTTVVIVGASHASVQAIDTLRREGHAGRIVLVGDEAYLPYNRPPLSKKFLAGELERERLLLRSAHFYEQHGVDTRLGVSVTAIDRASRRLRLGDGGELDYDQLLLCVGSRPRRLAVPGHDLGGIHYLRTIADVDAIRADLPGARRMVVVGAGYIGLEAAASARHLGLEVTVLEMADRPMNRVVAPELSAYFTARHAREGVVIHCNTSVTAFAGDGRVRAVACGEREFPADLVIVGVGILPDVTLAAAAGLQCDNGVLVDEHCRTSDPNVYAAGDCTSHPSVRYGRRVRLESVDNAVEQAKTAAANICGRPARHEHVPWFWSDQYDVRLQIAGLSQGYDHAVARGDPATGSFALYYLAGGELLAVDAVNSMKDFMNGKKWIAERKRPDPARLADLSIDLKTI
jgi:3-phenylpropionate/trans-cinnamate dioxygenase ferredoxin reductase component